MINHVNLGLFITYCWRSEIFEELCIHTHVETEQISRWKTLRYPSVLLFSLLTSRKAMLLIFPKVYWKHQRLSTHSAQLSIWTRPKIYIFHVDHPFIISPLLTFFHFSFLAVSAAGKAIAVSEETEKSLRVTWQPAPGNVLNYRITYKPKSGGRQLAAKVPGGNISTVLRRLTPLTTYDISVLPVYRSGEGKAREGEGTTCMLIKYCYCCLLVTKFRKNQTDLHSQSCLI